MDEVAEGECEFEGCPSVRFHTDEEGLWICENGHQQRARGQRHGEDEDDFGTQGTVHRAAKEAREKVYRVYRGVKAYQLFLQAYQLILWKQCHALIHSKGLPKELELLVRDLWTLRLQKLQTKLEGGDEKIPLFSSQSEAEDDTEPSHTTRSRTDVNSTPRLIDTIGLCYLGILLLKVPIGIGDLQHWIMSEEIPYMRAIRYVPLDMRERLPGEYFAALDTSHLPKGQDLHRAVADLTVLYQGGLGILLPPLNVSLLLFRYIEQLGVPPDAFAVVKEVARIVAFEFSWPTSKAKRYQYTTSPEAQLISLLIVALKLLYPFVDLKRYPRSYTEPAVQRFDWDSWADAEVDLSDRNRYQRPRSERNKFKIQERDVFDMTDQDLDEYMDWYAKTWLTLDQPRKKTGNELLEMFPISRTGDRQDRPVQVEQADGSNNMSSKIKEIQSRLKPRRAVSDEEAAERDIEVPRPGMFYKRYRTEDELPDTAKVLYERAAGVAALTTSSLVGAVFRTERRIQRWKMQRERGERPLEEPSDDEVAPDTAANRAEGPANLESIDDIRTSE